MTKILQIAILGASGYTGAELIRLLYPHPKTHIALLTGDSQAGKPIGEVYPHMQCMAGLPDLVSIAQADFSNIDVVFCCLPHGTTQTVIAALPPHVRIIDLSADFRLENPEQYAKWYGHAHQALALQKEAVYGLTEHAREAVKNARLVANPGCYPTSAQLPLIPLLAQKIVAAEGIIIDAKSGITGAGRSVKQGNLFAEVDGGISAYGIANHRHTPEIEQGLSHAAGSAVQVTFTPHLMPMNRGILSTIYAKLSAGKTVADARAALASTYDKEPFVHLLPEGKTPSTHMVRGTNHCVMNVFAGAVAGSLIIVSAIDNLTKGASGQAIQNMNVMFGLPETLGLEQVAVFP
jgi:N-acetyl-gamma-glutamyl-phosphate reductase